MKTCFLFPGQGAQYPGMGKDLWEQNAKVKEIFELASDTTGKNLTKLLFEGSEEELKDTDNTQIAVTVVNLSAVAVLEQQGIAPDACAGFSLGEYSALNVAGIIGAADIFSVVQRRGEIMAQASAKLATASGAPGMAAVLGLDIEEALPILAELEKEGLYLANHSSPTQIVVAGTSKGLKKAEVLFDKAGALRFIPLKVSGPFHSPLMSEARRELNEYLQDISFADPAMPIFANVTGKRIQNGAEARRLCVDQIVSTVQWVKTEKSLLSAGCDRFMEVGPGKVLAGLWKSFNKEYRCRSAGTVDAIEALKD